MLEKIFASQNRYVVIAVIVFSMGLALVFANRTVLYPLLTVIGREFSITSTQLGIVTSGYFLFYVAVQIPAGVLGDRFGLKQALVITYILAGIGLLAIGIFAHSYTSLLLTTILYGGGAGAYYPLSYSLAMEMVSSQIRGLTNALINTGSAVGLVLGLIMAGPFYQVTGDWRAVFSFLAVPTLLLALVFALFLRPQKPNNRAETNLIVSIVKEKDFLLIYIANFASLFAFWNVVSWGPAFFETERGMSLGAAGFYTATISLGGIPASLLFARLSDRLGRKRIAAAMLPVAALTLILISQVRSNLWLIFALVLYGAMGKLAWEPIAVSWVGDLVAESYPGSMGSALSLFGTIGMSSAIIGPVVAGWIRDLTGSLQGSFYLSAALLILGAFCMLAPREAPGATEPGSVPTIR